MATETITFHQQHEGLHPVNPSQGGQHQRTGGMQTFEGGRPDTGEVTALSVVDARLAGFENNATQAVGLGSAAPLPSGAQSPRAVVVGGNNPARRLAQPGHNEHPLQRQPVHSYRAAAPKQISDATQAQHPAPSAAEATQSARPHGWFRRAGRAAVYAFRSVGNHMPKYEKQLLRYGGAQIETLRSQPDLSGDTVAISLRQPLLTAEQVNGQLGVDMGELNAVLHLPDAKEPLYVFSKKSIDQQGRVTNTHYAVATPGQVERLRALSWQPNNQAAQSAQAEAVLDGILFMNSATSSRTTIGLARWIPGRHPIARYKQPVSAPGYESLAPRQTCLRVDETGVLFAYNPKHGNNSRVTPGPTLIEVNPHYVPAQDPFPGGPVYSAHYYAAPNN